MTRTDYKPKIASWPEEFAGKLPLLEVFRSFQGEGRFAGYPAIFLRFKYCNLGCSWCDTRFSWDSDFIEKGDLNTADEISKVVAQIINPDQDDLSQIHVVLTGGEPMLHADRLVDLIMVLKKLGFDFVEIETNGTIMPPDSLIDSISWWNCSPKLSNSGLKTDSTIVPEVLKIISATDRADFKFVVSGKEDIEEIERDFLPYIHRDQVMLMPEGITARKQLENMPWVLEEASRRGFRFSPRLHILAFGNQRGK